MIELDIRTLSIVAALSTVLLAAAMLLLMSVDPSVRAIRHWALGALLMSLAFCLIALRGLIPNVLSVVIANSSLAAGYALLVSGTGLFVGRTIRRSTTPVIFVCTLLAFLYWTLIAPDISARIVIISAVLAGLSFWSAFLLLMEMPQDMRLTRGFTAAVFIVHGAYLALRAGLMFGGPPVQDFMKGNWVNSLAFIDAIAMSILLIVGFVTMVARQLYLRMHQLARVDLLTDLPNRRAIEEAARRETARSHRLNQPLSLVLLDVDHFKQISDQYGHQCGDTVLQALAAAIARLLRPSDTFGRYGGRGILRHSAQHGRTGGVGPRRADSSFGAGDENRAAGRRDDRRDREPWGCRDNAEREFRHRLGAGFRTRRSGALRRQARRPESCGRRLGQPR